ncbi:OCIA domain-containing protein 1 [Harpegnathos saltator]|uniref:OCIA domain-containing protein 1 n=1 Tax=Harpegnathos saltator TaxID=610380 RepID=E2BZ21_HARSA|nr:OCIA domain-containing protein 1 [Harpegnathos saltator]EFN79060.1 OCIA domain-containing protein 1 [Harpegnathos saltator]
MATTNVQQPNDGRPDFRRRPAEQKLELVEEEMQVWRDCIKSSSIMAPTILGTAFGYGALKITNYSAYAKYSAMFSGVLSLLMSKLIISKMCLMKVISMPNSPLREQIKARYGNMHPSEKYTFPQKNITSGAQGSEEPAIEITFDDYPPMNSYDTYSSLNDSGDISEDMDLSKPLNLQQEGTTYEELRQKHREEYYNKNRQYYAPKVQESYPTAKAAQQHQSQQDTPARTSIQEKTKYGDVWG